MIGQTLIPELFRTINPIDETIRINKVPFGVIGELEDWTLGVNFTVPVGLHRDRALLRQQKLIIRRDQANLEQGLHNM